MAEGNIGSVGVSSCAINGCHRPKKTRGWCSTHYERWRVHGDPTFTMWTESCSVPGCERSHLARGLCSMHWNRRCRSGSVGETATRRRVYSSETSCLVIGCSQRPMKRGYCSSCYRRVCMKAVASAASARRRARTRNLICAHGPECVSSVLLAEIMGDNCFYCGEHAEHADHFEPIARGGLHCRDNIVPACAHCNVSKGARDPWEWWASRTDVA